MKKNNSANHNNQQIKIAQKTKFYLFSKLGSALMIDMVIAFGVAMVFNFLLITITPPAFISDNYWLSMLYQILPYILMVIVFMALLRPKIGYINDIKASMGIIEEGSIDFNLPIRGNDELSAIALSINELQQTLDAEIKSKEKLNQENHQLITTVSQNINTPLTAIIAYLESIRDLNEKNPIKRNAYTTALENTCQIKGLINNFFEHSLDDNNEISYDFKIYSGNKIMAQILDEMTFSLEEAGFKIVLENCIDRDFSLKVDLKKIRRIFNNLVSNILKYADPDKPIDLGLILNKNELRIVQRNKTKKILDVSGEIPIESIGFGLKHCESILLQHQGRINHHQLNSLFKIEISLPIYE
ncbi:HAMP domain-containing sensor histidine kinase [Acetobacterium bakii]|uniref:histidine kinase n=1 Tax=Acetobacterium bakii TaxID=52689 RepID=A0A0L6TY61_9FIRM|nr:HAMP domain-containing sensor histidine kinase [Acetobacterium bakii]KNZ40505.1 hypothetical protein AKG39_17285 [Acetobacterium bakii]